MPKCAKLKDWGDWAHTKSAQLTSAVHSDRWSLPSSKLAASKNFKDCDDCLFPSLNCLSVLLGWLFKRCWASEWKYKSNFLPHFLLCKRHTHLRAHLWSAGNIVLYPRKKRKSIGANTIGRAAFAFTFVDLRSKKSEQLPSSLILIATNGLQNDHYYYCWKAFCVLPFSRCL